MLPCVSPITAESGEFLGVAGFEVTLDFIKEHFLKPGGPIEATWVLDEKGRILVTSQNGQTAGREELPKFSIASVLRMVEQDDSGFFETSGNPSDVYVVYRMPTLDWFYVAEAPMPQLLEWQ